MTSIICKNSVCALLVLSWGLLAPPSSLDSTAYIFFLARRCVWPPPLFPRVQNNGTASARRWQGGFWLPPDGRRGFQSVASPSPMVGATSPLRGRHQDDVQLHTPAAVLLGHTPGVRAAVWTLERDKLWSLMPAGMDGPPRPPFPPCDPLNPVLTSLNRHKTVGFPQNIYWKEGNLA